MRSALFVLFLSTGALAQTPIVVALVKGDVSAPDPAAGVWNGVTATPIMLMGQPMVTPRPATTNTAEVKVQAVHDGKNIAFRLTWKDDGINEAGPLGTYSDAAALQFPMSAISASPQRCRSTGARVGRTHCSQRGSNTRARPVATSSSPRRVSAGTICPPIRTGTSCARDSPRSR